MTLRIPTIEDLRRAARANFFTLSPDEETDYHRAVQEMIAAFDAFDQTPQPREQLRYRDRDPGARPTRSEDPYNAIVRRCSVKGARAGKLAGKRVALKDNVCVAGIPMTCASLVLHNYVPDFDATIVTRILDAGAEIVAITNMDNFAMAACGETSAYGATLNPHDPNHVSGGSSSGSAAVLAYDDIDLAIGGDQGGSIRIPSSWCGVVGLKPTHSLVPYTGIAGIDATFDHAGPMTRTVGDAALLLEVIAGKDPDDPRQDEVPVQPYTHAVGANVKGMRVGLVREGFGQPGAEADVDEAVRNAAERLRSLGVEVQETSVPEHREAASLLFPLIAEGMSVLMRNDGIAFHARGLYNQGLAQALGQSRRVRGDDLPPHLKLTLLLGGYLGERYPGRFYAKAQNYRHHIRKAYDRALGQFNALLMPTTAMKAYRHNPDKSRLDVLHDGWSNVANTAPFDVTGHPALNVPCAKSQGLPVGLMLVGKHFDDATLLSLGHALEQSADWKTV